MRKEAVYDFVGLKKGEEKTVRLFIGYSFFMGVAVAIFYTATTSLFLIAFDRTMLPKAFIMGGVTVYALGVVVNYLQKKLRFTLLLNGLIYFLMLSVTGLVLAFQFSNSYAFIFFLFVWNRVFVFVNGITFWTTAAKIFNIQQAKRLFGLIGAGEVVSSILSFFSVPLLLQFTSTDQLLYIVSVSIVGCMVLMRLIVNRFRSSLDEVDQAEIMDTKPSDARSWKDFLANPYYRLVFMLAMMPVIGLFFVDFMFAIESKNVYPDKELLASFLGVFFGFCAVFETGIKTVVYGKIMNNYGLKVGITLLPVALLFSVTLAVGYGAVYGTTSLFFAFIVLSRFFTSPIRKSINEPAFQLLLQPIPTVEKAAVLSRIEGGPKALGNIIPGVILLALTSFSFVGTVEIAALFIIILVGWLYLSLKTQAKYRQVLSTLLQTSKDWANKSLDVYSSIARKIATLKQSPKLNYEYSNFDFIIKLCDSKESVNRVLAAELLGESGRYFAYRYLARLMNDDSPEVKEAALKAAGLMRKVELWPLIISNLNSNRFHQPAAYALMAIGEPVVRELTRSFVRSDGQVQLQLRIIRLMRQIGGADAIKFLRSLMNTQDVVIRDEVYASLKYLRYSATTTERSYIATELDSRIELLVWIIASQNDLESFPPWSQLHVALEKEKRRVVPKIFNLLSLLNSEQPYDFICDLLVREDVETYGYLLEVMNMTIPQEWKNKLIPLFEDKPIQEKLKICGDYYPTIHMAPEERLRDIVNKHYSRVSQWLKVSALRELAQLGGAKDTTMVFAALAVSPYEIIAEMALYELYKTEPTRFFELLSSMEAKDDTFYMKICNKILASPEKQDFLVHRVWVLSQTDLFSMYHEDELFELAGDLERSHLQQGQSIPAAALGDYEKALLIVSYGCVEVRLADSPTVVLEAFDTYETTRLEMLDMHIQAVIETELYYLDDQKVEGLRLIHEPKDVTPTTEMEVVE